MTEESGGYEEKPMIETSRNVSCGIYVIRRRLLIELIERAAEEDRCDSGQGYSDPLCKDIKRIYAYQLETYWNNISSVEAYYRTNMDFLKERCPQLFSSRKATVYSRKCEMICRCKI